MAVLLPIGLFRGMILNEDRGWRFDWPGGYNRTLAGISFLA
jgi:hypothetical protein